MEGLGKRPKTFDQHLRAQQGWIQFNTCKKLHDGTCHSRGLGCYKCGMIDHVSRDFPQGESPFYFLCDQVGHKRAVCPRRRGGVVSAPALTILWISDHHEGREGAGHFSVRREVILRVCYLMLSLRFFISSYVAWNDLSVRVSVIFGFIP